MLERTAAAAEGAAEGLDEGLRELHADGAAQRLGNEVDRLQDAVAVGKGHHAGKAFAVRYDQAKARIRSGAERTREAAGAVRETAHLAKVAPGHVAADVRQAGKAYVAGLTGSLGFWAATAAFGLCLLAALTAGLVIGLGHAVDSMAGGAFLTALLYAIAAGICVALARRAVAAGKAEAAQRLEHARDEVAGVARPLRRLRSRQRQAGSTHGPAATAASRAPQGEPPLLLPKTPR